MRLYTHPYYIDDVCFGFTFDLTPYLKKVRCNKKRVARKNSNFFNIYTSGILQLTS